MSQSQPSIELSARELRRLFRRHRGAAAALANELGVSPVTLSEVLRGKTVSRRISDAIRVRAAQLQDKELVA